MTIEVVNERKGHILRIDKKITKKIVTGCRKCDKFIEFKENTENDFPYMDWVICSSFGKQRVKTCSTCIKNENNITSKKNIRKTMRIRSGIYQKPDVKKKQKLAYNLH